MEEKDSEISGPCEEFRIWFCGEVPSGSVAWYCIDVSETTESSTKKLNPFSVSNPFPSVYYAFLKGCIYSLGGQGSDETLLNDVWILDIKSLDSFAARGEEKPKESEKPQEPKKPDLLIQRCFRFIDSLLKPYYPIDSLLKPYYLIDSLLKHYNQFDSKSKLSLSTPTYEYDVFVSFRGADTRTGFTSHLLAALDRKRIRVYKDDINLQRGEEIGPDLLKAIEISKIVVVVFSKNYVTSDWCLDELVKIMECKSVLNLHVLPIFYNVTPSEIRKQKWNFADALYSGPKEKVESWSSALTQAANLAGFHLTANRPEAEFIEEIVHYIWKRLKAESSFVQSRRQIDNPGASAGEDSSIIISQSDASSVQNPIAENPYVLPPRHDSQLVVFPPRHESRVVGTATGYNGLPWILGPPMTFARCNPHTMVVDQKLYVLGGFEPNQNQASGWMEGFDPVVGKWESLPSPPYQIHSSVMISGLLKAKKEIIIAKQRWDHHPMLFYSYNIMTRCWNRLVPHESKASVRLPPNAGRAVTVGNTLYWISTEEHNHECIIRAYDLDRNMWFKDHLNTATIFGRREHFSSIYSSRPGFLHLCDQKFCLLLRSSIKKDKPESSIEYLYCVILDISPIYEHEDRGKFELTTVSVQKYSMDQYIDFLDCMLGDRASGVESVDRRGQSTSANISFQEVE